MKLDRDVLAVYSVAVFFLLVLPIEEPEFRLLGISSDKWFHAALFGGLAMLLRWNLAATRNAVPISMGIAFSFAALVELIQALVSYRTAGITDLLAGFIGAIAGAAVMNRIMKSRSPSKLIGALVSLLGALIASLSLAADTIGVGNTEQFGPHQMIGTFLGMLIAAGGALVYFRGLPWDH